MLSPFDNYDTWKANYGRDESEEQDEEDDDDDTGDTLRPKRSYRGEISVSPSVPQSQLLGLLSGNDSQNASLQR